MQDSLINHFLDLVIADRDFRLDVVDGTTALDGIKESLRHDRTGALFGAGGLEELCHTLGG